MATAVAVRAHTGRRAAALGIAWLGPPPIFAAFLFGAIGFASRRYWKDEE